MVVAMADTVAVAALLGATLPLTGYYLWIRRLILKGNSHQPHGH